ncbi:MAG: SLBB domain-containing protein [Candidatus Korobacteraceae bacterium]|jgi:protein involved in polysaccharide export with SLBB domain
MRALYLPLLLFTALASLAPAQESTPAARPSQEECSEAASNGRPLPVGCTQDEDNVLPGRPQQESAPIQPQRLAPGRPESVERETIVPLNPAQRRKVELPLRPRTEFEQIVADTIGRALPVFGQSLFAQPPSTFAPTDRTQVPGDYVLGPDDELQIRIWGQINADLRVVVDRGGQIYIPRVGQVPVAGVHYSNLDQYLKSEIQKTFHNFDLTANIGRIRSIQVYVVGQARYPGTYTISSLSTLVNAVFASGGPTPQGSLRDVQVQRDGKTIAHMDFYQLLVRGDKSKDVRLRSGDVLSFPPVGPLVAIAGSVNAPAIYEMKHDSPLEDLLDVAGGLSTVADSNKVTVERIGDRLSRTVLEFPLDAESRALALHDGDIVRVFSIVPRFTNTVTLRGNVVNPGRYPWKPGMRVRDLIPDAQALLTRPYWLGRADMTDGRSTEYPIRTKRMENQTYSRGLDSLGLSSRELKNRDETDTDLGTRDLAGRAVTERDLTQEAEQPNSRESWLGKEAPTQLRRNNPNSETLTRNLHRASPEINWSYAIIQRVNPVDLSTKLLSFDLGKAVLEDDAANNLELQADDIITVFSQTDVSVPQNMRTRYISLEGEVVRAGVYKIEEGELLRDVVKRAGGVTPQAYIYGTQLTRESARIEQQKSIDELRRTLEVEMRQAQVSATARSNPDDAQMLVARQAAQEALIAQLRSITATGRVVLDLKPTANSIDDFPPIPVEDNDRIVVPHRTSTVSVTGMVYNPGSFVFNQRNKAGDYLRLAGKGKPNADMRRAFVLHADGTVVARKSVNGLMTGDKFDAMRMHPGDQIVVPSKIETGNIVRGLRDWTQITSQLALTGAALAVIH